LNFSKCKSSWSTRKQVALPIFSLRQSTLHEMNGNCYNNDWIGPEAPRRNQITFQSGQMMVTIVWNPITFHWIIALPKGIKFNTDY
jgi:hypothetical protein